MRSCRLFHAWKICTYIHTLREHSSTILSMKLSSLNIKYCKHQKFNFHKKTYKQLLNVPQEPLFQWCQRLTESSHFVNVVLQIHSLTLGEVTATFHPLPDQVSHLLRLLQKVANISLSKGPVYLKKLNDPVLMKLCNSSNNSHYLGCIRT